MYLLPGTVAPILHPSGSTILPSRSCAAVVDFDAVLRRCLWRGLSRHASFHACKFSRAQLGRAAATRSVAIVAMPTPRWGRRRRAVDRPHPRRRVGGAVGLVKLTTVVWRNTPDISVACRLLCCGVANGSIVQTTLFAVRHGLAEDGLPLASCPYLNRPVSGRADFWYTSASASHTATHTHTTLVLH